MCPDNLKRVWMMWKVSVRSKQCPDNLEKSRKVFATKILLPGKFSLFATVQVRLVYQQITSHCIFWVWLKTHRNILARYRICHAPRPIRPISDVHGIALDLETRGAKFPDETFKFEVIFGFSGHIWVFFSSARSFFSHPDLLVTHPAPPAAHFFRSHHSSITTMF